MKIVLALWNDAHFVTEDKIAKEDISNEMLLFSGGILIEDDEEALKLALDYSPETDDYREVQVIPRAYILSQIILDVDVKVASTTKLKKATSKLRKRGK